MFPKFDADTETYVVGDWRAIVHMVAELAFNLPEVAEIAVDLVLNNIETKKFHLAISSGAAMRSGSNLPSQLGCRLDPASI